MGTLDFGFAGTDAKEMSRGRTGAGNKTVAWFQ